MNKIVGKINLPINKWQHKWKKRPFWLRFYSKNMIFETNVTEDGRLIIEQIGWKFKTEEVTANKTRRIKDYKIALNRWDKNEQSRNQTRKI